MGMAVRPIFVFGEETVFANAVRRAVAMIQRSLMMFRPKRDAWLHLGHGGALNDQQAACNSVTTDRQRIAKPA
jgi:hypothetical protein